jgi:hypothetical protein
MFKIIYIPTGEIRSEHSTMDSVSSALSVIETTPPTHEVVEMPDPPMSPPVEIPDLS